MAISSRFIAWSTTAFLVVGFIALMSIVGANLWLGERARINFDDAIQARDTRGAAVQLQSAIQTAESAQRGFMVGGNEIYLAPYDVAKAKAEQTFTTLKTLLEPDQDAAIPVQRLTEIIALKVAEMDGIIALKRERKDAEALELFRTNRGKALMDEANLFLSGIVRRAEDRLTAGVEEQKVNAGWLRMVSALGALIIIGVVGGAAFWISRYTAELRTARDEVAKLNAGLEQRVSERTADLELARDKAQLLVREVNHRVANSLALVSSLAGLQAKALDDEAAKAALNEMQARVFAIAHVHKRLYSSTDVGVVMLDEYLSGLLDHLKESLGGAEQGKTLVYDVERIELPTDAGVNLGVVVTEWVTNAFKYAYPDGEGEIRVRLRQVEGKELELAVEDDGVGRIEGAPAKGTGLGTRIVGAMAASMRARIEYLQRRPGMTALMRFSGAGA